MQRIKIQDDGMIEVNNHTEIGQIEEEEIEIMTGEMMADRRRDDRRDGDRHHDRNRDNRHDGRRQGHDDNRRNRTPPPMKKVDEQKAPNFVGSNKFQFLQGDDEVGSGKSDSE